MAIFPGSAIPSAVSDYEIENSLRFNGTGEGTGGDYLTRTTTSAGSGSWTLSTWIKISNLSDGTWSSGIFGAYSGSTATQIYIEGNDKIRWFEGGGDLNPTARVFRDPSAWYHLVFQKDADTSMKIYVNGELTDTNTSSVPATSPATNSGAIVYVGQSPATNGTRFASFCGYQAEFYFVDGSVLDADDFGELDSTTNQWIPLDSDTVKDAVTFGTNGFYQKYGATELADSFTDSSYHNIHTVTAVGDAHTDTTIKKFGTASGQFDGTGDWLTIPDSPDWDWGTGDFTVDWWMYNTDITRSQYIWGMYTGGYGAFQLHSTTGRIYFYYGSGLSYDPDVDAGDIIQDQWQHFALQRRDSNLELFIDGVKEATVTSATHDFSGGSTFYVGAMNDDVSHTPYAGYLDEFRVSKGIARYTEDFTPATSAYTADEYTALLLHMDGSDDGTTFTDSSWTSSSSYVPRHTITANGDVTNTRAQEKIGDSSIYFDGTGDYLSSPGSSDWDFETNNFTVESWVNFSDISGTNQLIASAGDYDNGGSWAFMWVQSTSTLEFKYYPSASSTTIISESWSPSTSTWYHVAVVRSSDSWYLWVDGAQLGSTVSDSTDLPYSTAELLYVGAQSYNSSVVNPYDGYLDEIRISDSARYTSSFTPSTTEFTADSNTMLLIHSNWDGGLGADSSGNENDFSITNLVATDQMIDTPTNNFCTFNEVCTYTTNAALSEGNLKLIGSSHLGASVGTVGVSSGKWYWEMVVVTSTGGYIGTGIAKETTTDQIATLWAGGTDSIGYYPDTKIYNNGSTTSTSEPTYAVGDIIGVALDLTNYKLYFSKNGTWINSGDPTSGATGTGSVATPAATGWLPVAHGSSSSSGYVANWGQDSSFAGNETAQGNQDGNGVGDFYYEPPTDYLALCSDNLSDPEIALPGDNFGIAEYAGNSSTNVITTGLPPDFVWLKSTTDTYYNQLYDSVRGVNLALYSNVTDAEYVDDDALMSFDSTGFTLGAEDGANNSAQSYVTWNWKAGGTAVSNTDGSITSSVSANTTAGFSIAAYTGTGSAATIGHGLSSAPELIIVKNRDQADAWQVGSSKGIDFTDYLVLDDTAATTDNVDRWNDTAPSASVFTIGDGVEVNTNTEDYIAYCFHSVEGYSKIGIYEGNGDTDGPFIYTGFSPKFFLSKNIDATQNWTIQGYAPGYNPEDRKLFPNENSVEGTGSNLDFLSNGVKWRIGWNEGNGSYTYLYMAFAESPFKYSNAR